MLYLFSASVDTVSETTNQHESLQESLRVVEVYTFFLVLKFVFLKKKMTRFKKKMYEQNIYLDNFADLLKPYIF